MSAGRFAGLASGPGSSSLAPAGCLGCCPGAELCGLTTCPSCSNTIIAWSVRPMAFCNDLCTRGDTSPVRRCRTFDRQAIGFGRDVDRVASASCRQGIQLGQPFSRKLRQQAGVALRGRRKRQAKLLQAPLYAVERLSGKSSTRSMDRSYASCHQHDSQQESLESKTRREGKPRPPPSKRPPRSSSGPGMHPSQQARPRGHRKFGPRSWGTEALPHFERARQGLLKILI